MTCNERIGVVLVHGIGEQRRFEHLSKEVRDLLAALEDGDSVTTSVGVRETRDSQFGAEAESWRAETEAPVRVEIRCAGRDVDGGQRKTLHIHEVWWADLDDKATLWNRIMFWSWGLAMWNAKRFVRPDPCRAGRMGQPQPCKPPLEFWVRTKLFGFAVVFLLCGISVNVVNAVLKTLRLGHVPGEVLYRYVGDVKLYQDRKRDGKGPLTDLGLPPRFAIRRRMVDALVAAYKQDYDRWYILAHSLGSIVAFNGLMETEHALPNYLREPVWRNLLCDLLKTDPDADPMHVTSMMPRRPLWIEDDKQVLDRAKLFGRLRGFVTYGSPLDKFAYLWPQIVNINKDNGVFPAGFEWINVYDHTDPVGARLDAFKGAFGKNSKPTNLAYKAHALLLWSHTRYLKRKQRRSKGTFARLLLEWMLHGDRFQSPRSAERGIGTNWYKWRLVPILWRWTMWATVALLLSVGIAVVLELLFFECDLCSALSAWQILFPRILLRALFVVVAAVLAVSVAGLVRCWVENLLDRNASGPAAHD